MPDCLQRHVHTRGCNLPSVKKADSYPRSFSPGREIGIFHQLIAQGCMAANPPVGVTLRQEELTIRGGDRPNPWTVRQQPRSHLREHGEHSRLGNSLGYTPQGLRGHGRQQQDPLALRGSDRTAHGATGEDGVSIEKEEPLTSSRDGTLVKSPTFSCPSILKRFTMNYPDPRIRPCRCLEQIRCPVDRAIINK
jgi:hypothetical protein